MPPTKRYVLDHEGKVAKALKSSFTRFGKKLAAQLAKKLPAKKLAKGDVPGHEFHGNQYTDAMDAQDRLPGKEDAKVSTIDRWYDKQSRNWIVQRKDSEGYETHRAEYSYDKATAIATEQQFLSYHTGSVKANAKKADLRQLLRKAETPEEMVDRILKELDLDGYGVAVYDDLHDEILKSFEEGGYSGANLIGMANEKELLNQVSEEAATFAKERAATLVGKRIDADGNLVDNPNPDYAITETTRDGLRSLVSDAVEEGWGAGELEDAILDSYFFSDARAETIARTELAYAHVQGNLQAWEDSGVVGGKSSLLADTHPAPDVCDEAADEGVIGMDEQFLDEYDGPPYHPNCLCALVPTLQSEQSDEEGQAD